MNISHLKVSNLTHPVNFAFNQLMILQTPNKLLTETTGIGNIVCSSFSDSIRNGPLWGICALYPVESQFCENATSFIRTETNCS